MYYGTMKYEDNRKRKGATESFLRTQKRFPEIFSPARVDLQEKHKLTTPLSSEVKAFEEREDAGERAHAVSCTVVSVASKDMDVLS